MKELKELTPVDQAIVQKALDLLGEHFENVIIFVNFSEGSQTFHAESLKGNIFALKNHVERWEHGYFEPCPDDEEDDVL